MVEERKPPDGATFSAVLQYFLEVGCGLSADQKLVGITMMLRTKAKAGYVAQMPREWITVRTLSGCEEAEQVFDSLIKLDWFKRISSGYQISPHRVATVGERNRRRARDKEDAQEMHHLARSWGD